ncbi:MAG: acetyltransferase [Flavobacteriaceae bacterium TMED81]|nr:MAG: acetyltransferase [Flavobacteriaceae bacterium TMED81]
MKAEPRLPCVILGCGGHARSVLGLLTALNWPVVGCVAPKAPAQSWPKDCPWLGDDTTLNALDPCNVVLANGVGSVGSPELRRKLYVAGRALGFRFPALVHPSSIFTNIRFDEGVQVMAGAILQTGVTVGENALINTGVIVDHDCQIGAHSHLAPGVTLSGSLHVNRNVFVGTGAVLIQGVSIGEDAIVGAGAVVTKDVAPGITVIGNPAQPLKKR